MNAYPAREGVTVPDQPWGTLQLYCPEALDEVQLAPLVAASVTSESAEPPELTVPLNW